MSETPPAGYRKLPDGTRCRCIRLWQDGVGGFYCCRSSVTLAFADSLSQHCPNCEAQAAEIEKLREALRPFAKAGEIAGEPSPYGDWYAYRPAAGDEYAIFGQHLRDARAALGETK